MNFGDSNDDDKDDDQALLLNNNNKKVKSTQTVSMLFQCQTHGCEKQYSKVSRLKQHQLIHLPTKPFHCLWPSCVYSSAVIRHIQCNHMRINKNKSEEKRKQ